MHGNTKIKLVKFKCLAGKGDWSNTPIGQQTVLVISKEKSEELIRMNVDFRQPREATFCF